jgi:hypothetical protein
MIRALYREEKLKYALLAAAFAAALAGCATQPQLTPEEQAEAHAPLTCSPGEQCAMYWRRAQAWLALNSRMKIQIATDTVLETHNVVNHEPTYAFRLVRVPEGTGSERITIFLACGNMFGCPVPQERVAAKMKRYIRSGT